MSSPSLVCTKGPGNWYTITNDPEAYQKLALEACLKAFCRVIPGTRGAFDFWSDSREDVYEKTITLGGNT